MNVIVIGGGPAGMMCAGTAAERHSVILLDKNEKLGKKLYITGKGRANVTNLCSRDVFLSNVVRNPKFLMSAYYAFPPESTMSFYEKWGVPLKVERGERVFPQSDKSNDIIKAHLKHLENNNVKIELNAQVERLLINNDTVSGVKLKDGREFPCNAAVIATGGMSYPSTGSTGDGYKIAKETGHNVIEPVAALVPLELKEDHDLEGLSLKNVKASIVNANGKILFSDFGEMLFTKKGVSGPIILSLSSRINRLNEPLFLSIDLKPALSFEQLDDRVLRDFNENINRDFINSLDGLLPKSMIPEIISRSGIDPRYKVNQVEKQERQKLVRILKDLKFSISRIDKIELGIVTSGGVDTREINPKTMESKIVKGLYFVGEVLDVDALTGGFNIQIALSTGYLAAISV